ncbi:MAG TPA: RNA polymerase sigma factor [Solirubrobacteraceae bacterium]
MPRLDPSSLAAHIDALYRAAWALCGSREDAEDLVQDTFTRVLARPRNVQVDGERAYLMQALRNTFSSRLRTQSRRPRTVAPPLEDTAPDQRSTAQPERAAEMNEIFSAIGDLPEDFRLALVAVDILGLSYQEAASALGTREATITTRLYRARQRIAREFNGESPEGAPGAKATAESQPAPEKPEAGREGNRPNRSLA